MIRVFGAVAWTALGSQPFLKMMSTAVVNIVKDATIVNYDSGVVV